MSRCLVFAITVTASRPHNATCRSHEVACHVRRICLGQVSYLLAEQCFSDKQYEECIQELDVTRMLRLAGRSGLQEDSKHFLDISLQRLFQHACFLAGHAGSGTTSTASNPKAAASLKVQLRGFLSFFLTPEERATATASEAIDEDVEDDDKALEAVDKVNVIVESELGATEDFDAFDLSQQSGDEDSQDLMPEDNPAQPLGQSSTSGGRATHEVAPVELRDKLLCLRVFANYENESIDRVKTVFVSLQSEDPLFDRCCTSPHWLGLVDEVKGWLSEQELLSAFRQSISSRIGLLGAQVDGIRQISELCSNAVKESKSANDLGITFDQWWSQSWQKGELVTQAMEFFNEIEEAKDKARIGKRGLGLAAKVKIAKDMTQEVLNLTFAVSSHLWWLTVRLIKDTATAEAEPRNSDSGSNMAKVDAFEKHQLMWEEMAEVLDALQSFGLKMPRAWTTVLRATDLRKAWLSFGSSFFACGVHSACRPCEARPHCSVGILVRCCCGASHCQC